MGKKKQRRVNTLDNIKLHTEKQHKAHASIITTAVGWGTGLAPIPDSSGRTNTLNGKVEALATPAMAVKVRDLAGLVKGIVIGSKFMDKNQFVGGGRDDDDDEGDGKAALAIPASDPSNPRIDVVVAEVTWDEDLKRLNDPTPDKINLSVIQGTPAPSPVVPAIDSETQILLAHVAVGASVTQINPADITDKRDFICTVDIIKSQIVRIANQVRRFNRDARDIHNDHEDRLVTLEAAGGGGSLSSISTPIVMASGAGPNQLATGATNINGALLASDGILKLASTGGGGGPTTLAETFTVPVVGGTVADLDHPLAGVFAIPFFRGTGTGAAADEEIAYDLNEFSEPGILTGKTFESDFVFETRHKVGALDPGDTGYNYNADHFQASASFFQAANFTLDTQRTPQGPQNSIAVNAGFVVANATLPNFINEGFQLAFPNSADDLVGHEVVLKVESLGFGSTISATMQVLSGPLAGIHNLISTGKFISLTPPSPTAGASLVSMAVSIGLFPFTGLLPGATARTLELIDLKSTTPVVTAFSTPGVISTTDVDSVDQLITALLGGNATIPANTTITLEIDRGGGFEALNPLNQPQEFNGSPTGGTIVLRLTLATTDTSVSPEIRSLTFSSDNAARQTDWVDLATKYNAVIDKIVADTGNTHGVVVGDKVTIPS